MADHSKNLPPGGADSPSVRVQLADLRNLVSETMQSVLERSVSHVTEPTGVSALEADLSYPISLSPPSSRSSTSGEVFVGSLGSGSSRSRRRKTWRQSLQEQEDEDELLSAEDQLAKLRDLKSENRELRQELIEVNTRMTRLENKTIGKERATEAAHKCLGNMKDENAEISRELQKIIREKEEMRKARDDADIRALEAENKLLDYKTQVGKAARERGTSRSNSADHTECEQAQQGLLSTISLLKTEMNALRHDVSEQERTIERQEEVIKALESVRDTASTEGTNQGVETVTLTTKMAAMEGDDTVRTLREKVDILNRQIVAYRDESMAAGQTRISLETSLREAEEVAGKVKDVMETSKVKDEKLATLECELSEAKGKITELSQLFETGRDRGKLQEMTAMFQSEVTSWMLSLSRIRNMIDLGFFSLSNAGKDDDFEKGELCNKMAYFTGKLADFEGLLTDYKNKVSKEIDDAQKAKDILLRKLNTEQDISKEFNDVKEYIPAWLGQTAKIENILSVLGDDKVDSYPTEETEDSTDVMSMSRRLFFKLEAIEISMKRGTDILRERRRDANDIIQGLQEEVQDLKNKLMQKEETVTNVSLTHGSGNNMTEAMEILFAFDAEMLTVRKILSAKEKLMADSVVLHEKLLEGRPPSELPENFLEQFKELRSQIRLCNGNLNDREHLCKEGLERLKDIFRSMSTQSNTSERSKIEDINQEQITAMRTEIAESGRLLVQARQEVSTLERMCLTCKQELAETRERERILQGEKVDLESQIEQREAGNVESVTLRREKSEMSKLLSELEAKVTQYEIDRQTHSIEVLELNSTLEVTQAQIARYEDAVRESEVETRRLKQEVTSLTAERAELRQLADNAARNHEARMEEQANAAMDEMDKLKDSMNSDRELVLAAVRAECAESQAQAVVSEVEGLRECLAAKSSLVLVLEEKLSSTKSQYDQEIVKLKQEYTEKVEEQLEATRSLVTSGQTKDECIFKLQNELEEIQRIETELQQRAVRYGEEISNLKTEHEQRVGELLQQLQKAEMRVSTVEKECQRQLEIEKLKIMESNIESSENTAAQTASLISQHEDKMAVLKSEYELMVEELGDQRREIELRYHQTVEKLQAVERECQEQKEEMAILKSTVSASKESIADVTAERETVVSQYEESISSLKSEHELTIRELSQKLQEAELKGEALEKEYQLKVSQESSETTLAEQESLMSQLEERMSALKVTHEVKVKELEEQHGDTDLRYQQTLEELNTLQKQCREQKQEIEKLTVIIAKTESEQKQSSETMSGEAGGGEIADGVGRSRDGERQVTDLVGKLEESERRNKEVTERCQRVEMENERRSEELRKNEEEIKEYREQARQHAITIVTVEERLNTVMLRNKEYQTEIEQLKVTIEEMHHRMGDVVVLTQSPRVPRPPPQPKLIVQKPAPGGSTQPNQSAQQSQNLVRLRRENANLKNQYSQAQKVIDSLRRDLNGLSARLSDVTSEVSDAQKQQLDEKTSRLKDVDRDLVDHKVKVRELFTIVEEKLGDIRRLNAEVKRLKEGAAKLKKVALAKDEKVKELEGRLDKHQDELRQSKDKQEEDEKSTKQLMSVGATCRGERHEHVIANQKAALAELRARIKSLEQIPRLVGSHDEALQQVSLLKRELAEMRAQQALANTLTKDIVLRSKSPRDTSSEVERSTHRLTSESLDLSENSYLSLLKSVCTALNIDDMAGMRTLSNLPADEQTRVAKERGQAGQIVANRIELFRERLLRKDELLQGYEEDLAKLRRAEQLVKVKDEQLDSLTSEVRRRAEENQCLRVTIDQSRERDEQERRFTTTVKDKKPPKVEKPIFPALSQRQPPGGVSKTQQDSSKNQDKGASEKMKRKNYEIRMLKTELDRKDEQLHDFRRQVLLGPTEDYKCCGRKPLESPVPPRFRPLSAKEHKSRSSSVKTTRRPKSASKAKSPRRVPSPHGRRDIPEGYEVLGSEVNGQGFEVPGSEVNGQGYEVPGSKFRENLLQVEVEETMEQPGGAVDDMEEGVGKGRVWFSEGVGSGEEGGAGSTGESAMAGEDRLSAALKAALLS